MSCDRVIRDLPLYGYGELAPDREEEIERHLEACIPCGREWSAQRKLAAALRSHELIPDAALLAGCRQELGRLSARETRQGGRLLKFLSALATLGRPAGALNMLRRPAGALALVALGFLSARLIGPGLDPASPAISTIRSIQPEGPGQVRILLDETRRREVIGSFEEARIQDLLLAAAKAENPGLRLDAIGILKETLHSTEARSALLAAITADPNPGVRLMALEGLRAYGNEPEVRRVLSQVLLHDGNAGVRMQAVDLLIANRSEDLVGVLQNVVEREGNESIRLRSQNVLRSMNASLGTF
jgi:HEAT repeats/Putative zinc-finger